MQRLAAALHEHGAKSDLMESRAAFAEKRKPQLQGLERSEGPLPHADAGYAEGLTQAASIQRTTTSSQNPKRSRTGSIFGCGDSYDQALRTCRSPSITTS